MRNQKENGKGYLEIFPLESYNVANDRNCEELKVCSLSKIPKKFLSMLRVKYPVEFDRRDSDSFRSLRSVQLVQFFFLFFKLFVDYYMVKLSI